MVLCYAFPRVYCTLGCYGDKRVWFVWVYCWARYEKTDQISFFSNRSVKSILKNAPKRQEREEDDQMMELDPLEPDDEGVLSILLSFKIIF